MNGTLCAMRPAMKATSRDKRSSLATTGHLPDLPAASAAASRGRRSGAPTCSGDQVVTFGLREPGDGSPLRLDPEPRSALPGAGDAVVGRRHDKRSIYFHEVDTERAPSSSSPRTGPSLARFAEPPRNSSECNIGTSGLRCAPNLSLAGPTLLPTFTFALALARVLTIGCVSANIPRGIRTIRDIPLRRRTP
jgi:hypothetical protein